VAAGSGCTEKTIAHTTTTQTPPPNPQPPTHPKQYDPSHAAASPSIADTAAWKALQEHVVDIEQTCALRFVLGGGSV
jgi:hypothetical protein